MGDEKRDSKEDISEEFDLKKELSALIVEDVIPLRIADKLEEKLKEKQIEITKEQLYALAYKIKDIISNYIKSEQVSWHDSTTKVEQPIDKKSDANMQKLVETIEKLQERIDNIERGVSLSDVVIDDKNTRDLETREEKTLSPKVVTTEDIQVSERIAVPSQGWALDPLTKVPSDPKSIIVLMKWLQYLIDKCGRSHLPEILDYYVDIGWLSKDAKISLLDYSSGITEESKEGETVGEGVSDLPSRDHIQSLLFIQKLKGTSFDKHFLDRIDEEVSEISKSLTNYQFK